MNTNRADWDRQLFAQVLMFDDKILDIAHGMAEIAKETNEKVYY